MPSDLDDINDREAVAASRLELGSPSHIGSQVASHAATSEELEATTMQKTTAKVAESAFTSSVMACSPEEKRVIHVESSFFQINTKAKPKRKSEVFYSNIARGFMLQRKDFVRNNFFKFKDEDVHLRYNIDPKRFEPFDASKDPFWRGIQIADERMREKELHRIALKQKIRSMEADASQVNRMADEKYAKLKRAASKIKAVRIASEARLDRRLFEDAFRADLHLRETIANDPEF